MSEGTTPGKEEVDRVGNSGRGQCIEHDYKDVGVRVAPGDLQERRKVEQRRSSCRSSDRIVEMAALAHPVLRGTCTSRCNGGNAKDCRAAPPHPAPAALVHPCTSEQS